MDVEKDMKKFLSKTIACVCAFACIILAGCQPTLPDEEITVYMPDGAPALALAQLMHEDAEDDGITYRVVDASLIASKVTNKDEEKNADLCIMPVTAAAKLLGSGERYIMLGTVTHGNLFFVAKDKPTVTADNLNTLIGKKVGVLQMASVPGLTLKATLTKHQIPYQVMGNDGGMVEDKVNLFPILDATAVGTVEADYFMIAEPAASAQGKNGYSIAGNIQTLYGGENGYPQAVLVAKREFINKYSSWTKEFAQKIVQASAWLTEASGQTLVAAVNAHMEDKESQTSLKAPLLSQAALRGCGIRFTYAGTDFQEVNAFLTAVLGVDGEATKMPAQEFYWAYTE